MGIWPGTEHFNNRHQYCAGYVDIMRDLWAHGESNFQGRFFQVEHCKLLPKLSGSIPIICAAQSDKGTRFAAEYGDYNFCVGFGVN